MKQWTTAEVDGKCAFCGRLFKPGDRVVLIQPASGAWRKYYDGDCAKKCHGMSDDTGETHDLSDSPNYPKPLKELAAQAIEDLPFDYAKAAANDRD